MADSDVRVLKFDDISPASFKQALDFIYAGHVTVSVKDLLQILVLADRFVFSELRQACITVVTSHMDSDNCVDILSVGNYLNCTNLVQAATDFISSRIYEASV
jgi:hypothetical protein